MMTYLKNIVIFGITSAILLQKKHIYKKIIIKKKNKNEKLKFKRKSYNDDTTYFLDKEIPKVGSNYTCLAVKKFLK